MAKGNLILGRYKGEQFVVGEGETAVTVTVVEFKGIGPRQMVRLAIEADKSVPIRRAELPRSKQST